MTIKDIRKLHAKNGLTDFQRMVETGQVWLLEGWYGRQASEYLESGVCFLPTVRHRDYWGNTVPSRNDLKPGTKGTLENSIRYWSQAIYE